MKKAIKYLLLLAVIGVGIYYFTKDTSSTISEGLRDFAIENAEERVSKIFFADVDGNKILLERRDDGFWDLNKQYLARPTPVKLLLDVFKNIEVQSPIQRSTIPLVNKLMAVNHVKVEIYTEDEDKPEKVWYVGHPSGTGYGTHMLLEIPGEGRSSVPYLTHILGFKGHLKARFFTNLFEWRYTKVFEYPNLEFESVKMDYPKEPKQSFSVELDENGDLKLLDNNGQPEPTFDTAAVREFIIGFKKIHFDSVTDTVSQSFRDSVFNSTPLARITVKEKEGVNHIDLFPIKAFGKFKDTYPDKPWDPNRMYGNYKGEFVYCQYHVFDRIMYRKDTFLP